MDYSELKSAIDDLKAQGVKDFSKYLDKHPEFLERSLQMIRVTDFNNEALSIYGAEHKEELLGRSLTKLVPAEASPQFRQEIIDIAKGNAYHESERTNKTLQGDQIHILLRIAFPSEPEGFQSVLSTAMNITKRKHAEEDRTRLAGALEATRRLEKMKSDFISTVTHELRTPLVSIKGYIDFALSGKLGDIPDRMREMMTVVSRNAEQLSDLTDDLLDIQRIESGKLSLQIKLIDLRETLWNCLHDIEPMVAKKNQSCELEPVAGKLLVKGDSARLTQVVMNLLNNASKFTPEGGSIRIGVGEKEDTFEFRVSDTGLGLRPEDFKRVFEPFAKIEKREFVKGTGLGLSVSKRLVEAHGGKIWVESGGEGKGATFTFTLPKPEEEK